MVAEEPGTIADDLVVTKYKMAAEITNSKCNLYYPSAKVFKVKIISYSNASV